MPEYKSLFDLSQQSISSKCTSVHSLPTTFKKVLWAPHSWNLDLGGGQYEDASIYLQKRFVSNFVYDPFNRSDEHNERIRAYIISSSFDTVTCCNVLNVIKEAKIRHTVIEQAYKALKLGGVAYFQIYEGDRSQRQGKTSKGYQLNWWTSSYVSEITKVFHGLCNEYANTLVVRK